MEIFNTRNYRLPLRMDYFKNLCQLLQTEREEDRAVYRQLTARSTAAERRANGLTWYPVAIRGTELGRGDYLTVELERTTHLDIPHQLRFGASVQLFSNHDAQQDRIEGTVTYQGGHRLKISLRTDELPEWSRNGKLGIDLLFDDNSYDEMLHALRQAAQELEQKDGPKLIPILTGQGSPSFDTPIAIPVDTGLNEQQDKAVAKIVAAQDLAIVHGPPGTGKTTTLIQAILELIRKDGKQILVVAPSNTAVDLLSEKLSEAGLQVLRVGNPARVTERLMALTLDSKMAAHPQMKQIRKLKKQAAEFKDMAHKYKRSFGKAEREQRKALFDEAHRIMKEVGQAEQYITDDIVHHSQVIAATLVGANHYTVRKATYATVVIDEAGQALEPACWIPVLKARKLIMAGDHCQLPPTIKSLTAAQNGLATTLLEKMVLRYPEAVVLLEEQYRMHRLIMGYSSRVFYEDKLQAHTSVADAVLFPGDLPLTFIDTAGCGFEEQQEGTSIFNPEEAAFLFKHLGLLAEGLKNHYAPDDFPSVGIISPYKQQVFLMKDLLQDVPALAVYGDRITVNTIDSFQGQERDIIYISMTRSNAEGVIGFLADIRRMNVAMTRARKKLVIIGDSATLSRLPFYANFIAYAEQCNAWQSAWEFAEL